jgi:hypothetical protein
MADFCGFCDLARQMQSIRQARLRANDNVKVQGNRTMHANALYYRNALFAVAFSALAGLVFMAGAVGPAMVA